MKMRPGLTDPFSCLSGETLLHDRLIGTDRGLRQSGNGLSNSVTVAPPVYH